MNKVLPPYDRAILAAIETHDRVYNEYRAWLFKKGIEFDHKHVVEYLEDVGYHTEVVTEKGQKKMRRYAWTINGVTYANYYYQVELNANYSCVLKAIKLRQMELES